jgi:hypothetical protein
MEPVTPLHVGGRNYFLIMRSGCVVPGPDGKEWSEEDRKALLELYVSRMPFKTVAQLFDCSTDDVVKELARVLLRASNLKRDENSPNYGKNWTWIEDQLLKRDFQLRRPIKEIARGLGRDSLGIAYRVLETLSPQIPPKWVRELISDSHSGHDSRQDDALGPEAKTCSECLDVTIYCKCLIKAFYGREAF